MDNNSKLQGYELCVSYDQLEPTMDIKLVDKESGEIYDAGGLVKIEDKQFFFNNKIARKKYDIDVTPFDIYFREFKTNERLMMEDILNCLENGSITFTKGPPKSKKPAINPNIDISDLGFPSSFEEQKVTLNNEVSEEIEEYGFTLEDLNFKKSEEYEELEEESENLEKSGTYHGDADFSLNAAT